MGNSKDAAIRARAYQLWVESGYADGYHEIHWRQAEREVAERDAEGRPEGGEAPAPRPADDSVRHTDGLSTFPSVLDPGPARPAGT